MSTRRPRNSLAALVLASLGVLLTAAPAYAQGESIQLTPSTVDAGYLVGIRANCGDNRMAATVESRAFAKKVTVQPQNGVLTAAATVPENTAAQAYRVELTCPNGRHADATLNVVRGGRPTRGPATGFGGTADEHPGGLLITGGLAAMLAGAALGVLTRRRRSA
jgi:hypothetical protein